MANSSLIRKCDCCKKSFSIQKDNINEVIYYDNKHYHSRCFIKTCEDKSNEKRKDTRQKWSLVLNDIDNIKRSSYIHLNNMIAKEDVFQFICEQYNITVIPTKVWHKIGNIYNGSFKGMSIGIQPSHLLDMWQRKIGMLNKIYANNKLKGKTMTNEQRVNYDLSILVNKYDSYLKWLEKQKILESEVEDNNVQNNIVSQVIMFNKVDNRQEDTCNDDDISDLVDDIFD